MDEYRDYTPLLFELFQEDRYRRMARMWTTEGILKGMDEVETAEYVGERIDEFVSDCFSDAFSLLERHNCEVATKFMAHDLYVMDFYQLAEDFVADEYQTLKRQYSATNDCSGQSMAGGGTAGKRPARRPPTPVERARAAQRSGCTKPKSKSKAPAKSTASNQRKPASKSRAPAKKTSSNQRKPKSKGGRR